ncbi:hypothetical protein HME9302_02347 [Alteripontixanthobacter maritimus]|uniref:RNA-binding S4 domain-containing protein n=1 Tax=Alteripontixanthobacter maritimus TaxID=2161824 RepID=A0A369QFQ2_9SPHN|nr:S4 domain-containing protein [Alteripontixanthobacter maritimus]RDC61128.1 hypothetical protein HME9302_02347 [Alteripontixanthobacter maritimus]
MRLDRLLCYLRLARTRSRASAYITRGHMRINGQRTDRPAQAIEAGDVLTLMLGNEVRVLELLALPNRRGPAAEARSHYRVLDASGQSDLAAPDTDSAE